MLFVLCLAATQFGFPQPKIAPAKVAPAQPAAAEQEDPLQQRYDAAYTFYLGGDGEHAVAEYHAFLAEAFHRLANAYSNAKEFHRSSPLFESASSLAPGDNNLRLDYARSLLQQGKFPEARALVENIKQSGLDDAKTQALLGQILYAEGDYKGARGPLEAAVVAAPSFEIGYLLGMTYLKLKDFVRARLLFSDMVQGLGDSAPIHLQFARAFAKADEDAGMDDAISELKKAIAKDTTLRQAHYLLAVAYLTRDGEPAFAAMIPELRAELENSPEDPNTHYLLGYIAFKQHDPKTAEQEFRRSAAVAPENPDTWTYLGEIHADAGQDDEAEAAFRRAIALSSHADPDDFLIPRAHYMLGRVLLKKGQTEEGKHELEISKDLRDRANRRDQPMTDNEDDGKAAARLNDPKDPVVPGVSQAASPELREQSAALREILAPRIADAYNNLGAIAAAKQQFGEALLNFQTAGEWNPSLETLDRNLGMAAFYANQYDKAIPPLVHQLAKQPDDVRVRTALGLSYFGTSNYSAVLETVKPRLSILNDDPALSYAYAASLVKTGDDTEGVQRLQALAANQSSSAEIHALLGEAFADLKDYTSAIDEFRKSLAIDPNQPNTVFYYGLALLRLARPSDAVEQFRKSLTMKPGDVRTKYHLAFALLEIQKNDEAAAFLREVVEQDPSYVDAYYELGKLELQQGDAKTAITILEKGTELGPDRDYIHYQLAMAYKQDARLSDAERELKVYKSLKDQHRGRNVSQ